MNETAFRTTWKNFPIDNPKRIDVLLQFTNCQYLTLIKGLVPREMEDKWFIFYENDWLYFHRSWTGFGMYKAHLVKEQNGYYIKEFWAERNPDNYSNQDDKADIESFTYLIARGLLGIDACELYANKNIRSGADSLKGWSMFGNLLFTYPDKGIEVTDEVMSVLFGLAVGDALGVPVEFKSRETIRQNPVKDMIGFGTHKVPAGTWSDDSSLAFCLAESLTTGFDLHTVSQNFQKWLYQNYWTPYGKVFDVGITTQQAIRNLSTGTRPDLAGSFDENANGNGSLMRILPLLFYIKDKPIEERYMLTKAVSAITHGHIRSVISCFYYLEFARGLLNRENKFSIYNNLKAGVSDFLNTLSVTPSEMKLFGRLLKNNIHDLPEEQIQSSGYVLHTLEASVWCLLTTHSYKGAVLKAVNLGKDTDTTGAVTGGLAGLLYGFNNIPETWMKQLARREDIEDLGKRLITQITNG